MSIRTNVETSMRPLPGLRVPARPDQLEAAWLGACLQHAGVLAEGQRVTGFELERIGEGHGFAGQVARLTMRYDPADAQAPATIVAKFASDHTATREMLEAIDGYAREVRFYRELAPQIGVGTPRCYFAHYDKNDGSFCLLLEDLAPAACVDQEQGFTLEQAQVVLEQIAVLHARYWNKTEQVAWLQLSERTFALVRSRFLAGVPRFVERYGGEYPTLARVAQQLVLFFSGHELEAQARRPPLTLAHNDLHSDNVFMPGPNGGRFALIDWQSLTVVRQGTTDVARVLCMGLRPELRRKHTAQLLRHYHRALRAHGVHDYSLRSLRFRYRQELVTTVLISVLAFDTLDFGAHADDAPKLIASRVESALIDARVSALLTMFGLLLRARRWLARLFAPLLRN